MILVFSLLNLTFAPFNDYLHMNNQSIIYDKRLMIFIFFVLFYKNM